MMTISESQYSSNKRSSIHTINDKVVRQDNYNDVQQSSSTNSALVTKRGFKPSDMFDPQKKEFLTNLSYKLFPVSWNEDKVSKDPSPIRYVESGCDDLVNKPSIIIGEKEVDLNKIFTPAPDAEDYIIKKNKKSFASSDFYAPGLHPTVREQMELARRISSSLSDSSNQMSKGQSMYVNRKKRSAKWVHEGKGRNTSNTCATPTPSANHDTPYRPPSTSTYGKQLQINSSATKCPTYSKGSAANDNPFLPKLEPFPVSNNAPTIVVDPYPNVMVSDLYTPLTKLSDLSPSYGSKSPVCGSGKNYNTAPRGWGELKDYYRPVTFDDLDSSLFGSLPYTDY